MARKGDCGSERGRKERGDHQKPKQYKTTKNPQKPKKTKKKKKKKKKTQKPKKTTKKKKKKTEKQPTPNNDKPPPTQPPGTIFSEEKTWLLGHRTKPCCGKVREVACQSVAYQSAALKRLVPVHLVPRRIKGSEGGGSAKRNEGGYGEGLRERSWLQEEISSRRIPRKNTKKTKRELHLVYAFLSLAGSVARSGITSGETFSGRFWEKKRGLRPPAL